MTLGMAAIAERKCKAIVFSVNIKANVQNQILRENKTMDKKEKKVLTKLFSDQDDGLLALLLMKAIITITDDKKEVENDSEKVAM
jgi:hypothetical protein